MILKSPISSIELYFLHEFAEKSATSIEKIYVSCFNESLTVDPSSTPTKLRNANQCPYAVAYHSYLNPYLRVDTMFFGKKLANLVATSHI